MLPKISLLACSVISIRIGFVSAGRGLIAQPVSKTRARKLSSAVIVLIATSGMLLY